MSYYFLDSSALTKRYVPETGTAWLTSLILPATGNIIMVAKITQAEVVSGVMRRSREGNVPVRTARAIRLLIDRHSSRSYVVTDLTDAVVQRAENLLENHPLRAYDAVQLASALESSQRLVASGLAPLTFISADNRLLSVAAAEGLTIDDPNQHP